MSETFGTGWHLLYSRKVKQTSAFYHNCQHPSPSLESGWFLDILFSAYKSLLSFIHYFVSFCMFSTSLYTPSVTFLTTLQTSGIAYSLPSSLLTLFILVYYYCQSTCFSSFRSLSLILFLSPTHHLIHLQMHPSSFCFSTATEYWAPSPSKQNTWGAF